MTDIDTSVTGEEVVRDDAGDVERLKLKHYNGTHHYWTVLVVNDSGDVEFSRFSPILPDGRNAKATKKIQIFDQSQVELVDFENVRELLASAAKYARDIHDLDVKRAIYIDEARANTEVDA